jgi:hypothetical protein
MKFSQFTLGFLGLALCVFMWGLQYKLSLYDPPQSISHKIPTAKLLSKDEQAADKASLLAKSSASEREMPLALLCFAPPLLAAMDLLYRPALVRREADVRRPWRRCLDASLNVFSFRPPPIPA